MIDKRHEPRPCQTGMQGLRTRYKLGNKLALKVVRTVPPIVKEFKEARIASGLSQTILAERAGYDRETISRFERGLQSVSVAKFADLCAVIGLALVVMPICNLDVQGLDDRGLESSSCGV